STLFIGIAAYFLTGGIAPDLVPAAVITSMVGLAAGLITSYARARAEGLGIECKVGIAQRAERILVLGAPTVIWGAGPQGYLLFAIVALLALTAIITVGQRIVHVHRAANEPASGGPPRGSSVGAPTPTRTPALADSPGKGQRSV